MFQKLDVRSSSKKPNNSGSTQFCEELLYLYKNCTLIFGAVSMHQSSKFSLEFLHSKVLRQTLNSIHTEDDKSSILLLGNTDIFNRCIF
ncbi:hypothetical protein DPV73_08810 [Leptospira mayottensis]|nr:hypothetical protein DPV73_08810 [Leptospira mayottensis]